MSLVDVAADAELTGNHSEGCQVIPRMRKHRQATVIVRDLIFFTHKRQAGSDLGNTLGKQG